MRVIIRDAAYDDLERIFRWIERDRPQAAHSVIERILVSIERLGELPHIGHKGKAPGTLEWVVTGLPYIVIYKIDTDHNELQITAIFHGAQDR